MRLTISCCCIVMLAVSFSPPISAQTMTSLFDFDQAAFSYQMDFDTTAGQWTEVKLPVDKFVAHSYGCPMRNLKLNPAEVQSVGILLGDKKPGSFEILVDRIGME